MVAKIEQFLGVNEDIDTQLKLGEASSMQNYRVTPNFKLQQVEGYTKLVTSIAAKKIQGQWYGKIGSTYYHLVACNGTLYKIVAGTPTSINTLTDAPTFMFYNNGKVYVMNGTEYKEFNGTTLIDVVGYVPTIAVATPPAGGGTDLEDVNLLNGQKKQTFSSDGSATYFQLRETALTSVDLVVYNGTTKTVTTHYTVDTATGRVSPVTPADWATGVSNVSVTWTKTSTANRAEINTCRKAIIFGTRVHVFGNSTYKNRRWHSGLVAAITAADYFPATQFANIGPDKDAITDIVSQYDRQIIFTDGGRTFYSYYLDIDGVIGFPYFELNETIGNQAFGQVQVLDNFPVSLQGGVYRWTSTGVRDERNAENISKRVKTSIDAIGSTLSSVKTYDWETKRELWIASGKTVLVYNYGNDTWYKLFLNNTIESMLTIDGVMHFGTDNGEIMKFDDTKLSFNGVAVSAEWEGGYYDFGAEWQRKFTNQVWITMEPAPKVNMKVYWATDRDPNEKEASVSTGYHVFTYSGANYGDWTYSTSSSPRPKRVGTKAKKFAFLKLILRNSLLDYTSSVLAITFDARIGGNVK